MKLRRLKILSLDTLPICVSFHLDKRHHLGEIMPIVNRNGFYSAVTLYGHSFTWIEVDSKAYQIPTKTFDYRLKLLSAGELSYRDIDLLKQLKKAKLATSKQKKLIELHEDFYRLKKTKALIKLMTKRFTNGRV